MFGFSLVCMSIQSALAGVTLIPINVRGGDTADNRNQMVMIGREQGAEALLFLDADMVFPPDTLIRLLNWKVDIVGADYRLRAPPYTRIGLSPQAKPYPADHVDPERGLVERSIIGLGCVLVRAPVLERLAPPWFARPWLPDQATPDNPFGFSTDDSFFFQNCRRHGFKVWCDMAVTREVQHIGEVVVPWQMPTNARWQGDRQCEG